MSRAGHRDQQVLQALSSQKWRFGEFVLLGYWPSRVVTPPTVILEIFPALGSVYVSLQLAPSNQDHFSYGYL